MIQIFWETRSYCFFSGSYFACRVAEGVFFQRTVAGTTVAFAYSPRFSLQARCWWLGFVREAIPFPDRLKFNYRIHPTRIPLATEYTNQKAR